MAALPIVLADDFTGATELAGVAWRYGLPSEVFTEHVEQSQGHIACYDAHTRSLTANESVHRTRLFAESLAKLSGFLFKKTDSLLRGHVAQEIQCLLQTLHKQNALLCPANPARGRTIFNSQYYINKQLLALTVHANDPEYPRLSNYVYELLGEPATNIELPDIVCFADLRRLAEQISEDVLPAGGAEFFESLLQREGHTPRANSDISLPRPWCFVCGSLTGWKNGRQQDAHKYNIPIVQFDQFQSANISQFLQSHGVILLAIGEPVSKYSANELLIKFTQQVASIMQQNTIGTLFLEGGATARSLIDLLHWSHFRTVGELAPGCVSLREIAGRSPTLVCKPGSYAWPSILWEKLNS